MVETQLFPDNIDPVALLLASTSYVDFSQTFFQDPDVPDTPLILEPGQRKAINALQFGYDIDATPDNYINGVPPKGIVMIWPRQTGKTTAVAVFCATALILEPGIQMGVMAHTEAGAKNLIDRIKKTLQNSPFVTKVDRFLKFEINMKDGGTVRGHSNSEGIRGFSYHYLLMDEAAKIDGAMIEGAALHTTRKIGKRWVMLSTPKGYGGTLVKYWVQGLKTRTVICKNCLTEYTQNHFEVAKFDALFMSPGLPPCAECGFELEDETQAFGFDTRTIGRTYFYGVGDYTVIAVDPWTSSFYTKESIFEELEKMGNTPTARQELLGEIIPEGQGVFTMEWWNRAINPHRKNVLQVDNKLKYVLSIDFGKIHDNSVIMVGHEDIENKRAILDYMKIIYSKYSGKDYEEIKNDIIEIVKIFKPSTIVPDSTGMGEPIVEQMEKDLRYIGWYGKIYCNKKNRLGFIFDTKSKPDLIENLQQYFARGRIEIPNEYEPDMEVLKNELLNFSYEITNTSYVKYGVQLEHDDTVIALALFIWGLRYKPWIPMMASYSSRRGNLL